MIYNSLKKGFTLIEMLIVMGVICLFIGLSLVINLNNYRSDAFGAERDRLIILLQTARADALNNIGQSAHGVSLQPSNHQNSYVSFEGFNYSTSNSTSHFVSDLTYPIHFSPDSPSEIIFYPLSGNAFDAFGKPYDGTITMSEAQHSIQFSISINHEGRISW